MGPLPLAEFKRDSPNTMEAVVPAGTVKVELFSNWHRGWKWRDDLTEKWQNTCLSPIKGTEVVFGRPTAETHVVYFRFDPRSPDWVLVVSGLSALALVALGLTRGRRRDE